MVNFPTNPQQGVTYTINGKNFIWNGVGFIPKPSTDITVDAVPTDGSANPVASNGVFDALAGKVSIDALNKQYQVATTGLTTFLLSISQLEKIVAIPTKYNIFDLKLTPVLGGADIILIVGGVVQTLPINLAIGTYNATIVYSVGTSNASIIIETQKQ